MASGITLSAGVRQNLLSLQQTGSLMSTTQNRLATGKKVNSALDNPTNFFTSASLQSRSNDLSSLLDSMSNGIKTLEAADNGLTSITKTVESMQSTLRQARQDKSFQTSSYNVNVDPAGAQKLTFSGGAFATATDFDLTTTGSGQYKTTTAAYAVPVAAQPAEYQSAAAIDMVNNAVAGGELTISFGGNSVTMTIVGGAGGAGRAASTIAEIQAGLTGTALDGVLTVASDGSDGVLLSTAANVDGDITVSGAAEAGIFGAQITQTGSNGKTEFSVNGTAVELATATTGASLAAAVIETNRVLSDAGVKFQAFDSGGKLGIRATSVDSGSLAIGGADAGLFGTTSGGVVNGVTSAALTLAQSVDTMVSTINGSSTLSGAIKASNDNGKLRIQNLSTSALTVTGSNSTGAITGKVGDTSTIAGNDARKNLVAQFNGFRDQLDKLSDDASFNGINLLRGDNLKITFNENATSSIDIQAKDASGNPTAINASNLDIDTAMNADFDSDTAIDAKLDKLSTALTTLRSQASSFGSNLSIVQNRQDFTKTMMTTLQTGADSLTLADTNEEGANMLALQTRQQLSTTALSMANQANQAVLRLF
jgi:flagellin-like hook-associated protein FlgL